MRVRQTVLIWAWVGGLLGAAHAARAQPVVDQELPSFRPCLGQVTRAEQDKAKDRFAAGRLAYEEGEYRLAIRYWRDAFDLDCNAVVILRNLANVYERARNLRAAIVSLETYLARKPDADDAPTVRRRIENLRRELETSKSPEAPPAATTAPGAPPAAPTSSSASAPAPPPPAANGANGAIGSRVVVTPSGPGPWPWVLTGAGGAALAAGVYFFVDGTTRVSDARAKCRNNARCDSPEAVEDGNEGNTRKTIGGVLMGGGAAAVAGGLTWYFLATASSKASTSAARPALWLMPVVGGGYGGLGAGGRF
jgi:tetratricopeptide (TPR) repeat protein